ncbi:MAG TPA: hypothetical protein VJ733_09020 [Candidatus Binatia bacterium]|nr:hypothetical protein [Candidatus Binatia bacterium]
MDDITVGGAAVLFVIGWYGLIRLSGHFCPSQWRASVVWCARMKCMSLIETEPPQGEEKNSLTVSHCLLWPDLHDCDQRCIR